MQGDPPRGPSYGGFALSPSLEDSLVPLERGTSELINDRLFPKGKNKDNGLLLPQLFEYVPHWIRILRRCNNLIRHCCGTGCGLL